VATMWIWTFALDDGSVLRASIHLTSRVECVYHGDKLVSRLRKGSRTAHELILQPATPDSPAAAPYRAGSDVARAVRLVIDTSQCSCTLTVNGTSILPSSHAEVSDVDAEGNQRVWRSSSVRLVNVAGPLAGVGAVLLAACPPDRHPYIRHRGDSEIWTPGRVLGIVLLAVGIGLVVADRIRRRRGDRK
jgi:hypothetical protein